jgi:hypothetical protein
MKQLRAEIAEVIVKFSNHSNVCRQIVENVWNKFDKIRHSNYNGDYDYFKQLKQDVVIPLGLDPNII